MGEEPRFFLRRPAPATVDRFLVSQDTKPFSYQPVGLTAHVPPATYDVDHYREELGHGRDTFQRACQAILGWQMVPKGWVSVYPADDPIQPGATVAVLIRAYGLWTLNACRVAYLVEEDSEGECRCGFAYGTLAAHVEMGEERFLAVWNRSDDVVRYDLLAVSRPNHWAARLTYPLARRLQRRFARESIHAVRRHAAAIQ